MVQRCNFCGLFASEVYPDSGFYRLNDLIYCSLNCFNDESKNVPKPKKKTLGKAIKHSKEKKKLRETKRRSKTS